MSKQELLRRASRELMPGVIYSIVDKHGVPLESYGDTADGHGMYWYESLDDVAKDYNLPDTPILELTEEELEEIRYAA